VCEYNVTLGVCQGNSADIADARRSFISGHSSYSYFAMTFLSLYIFGKLGPREYSIVVFNSFLMMIAVWVGISRTADYEHHATDVIAGGVLGLLLGLVIYHLFYPSIFNQDFAFRAWPLSIQRRQTAATSSLPPSLTNDSEKNSQSKEVKEEGNSRVNLTVVHGSSDINV